MPHATTDRKKKPRGAGGGRGDLTVGLILDTAKALVAGSAFERLSVKELADELHVRPPAIYYHLTNKSHLLDLLAEQILREVKVPDQRLGWKERLRRLILEMRDTFVSYPGLGRYMLCHRAHKATALWYQKHLKVLREGGFSEGQAAEAMMVLQCYINPLNTLEDPELGDGPLGSRKTFGKYAKEDPASFDTMAEVLPFMRDIPYRTMYELGLPAVIEGMEKYYLLNKKR